MKSNTTITTNHAAPTAIAGTSATIAFWICYWIFEFAGRIQESSSYCQDNSSRECMILSMAVVGLFFASNGLMLLALGFVLRQFLHLRKWPAFATAGYVLLPNLLLFVVRLIWGWQAYTPSGLKYLALSCGFGYGMGILIDLKEFHGEGVK